MATLIFWSIMIIAFIGYIMQGWNDIEEWFWIRGARREIRKMERMNAHERQEER